MKTTKFRRTTDGTYVHATYGLHKIGDQAPHFSVTLDEYKHPGVSERGWLSGGCQHEQVARYFPELAPFVRWHLTSTEGPMHYVANGLFWHDSYHGRAKYGRPEDRALAPSALASTIVLGALEDDFPIEMLWSMSREDLKAWLEARLPRLLAAFQTDMDVMSKLSL
jgi:hypothetical protein